MKDEEIIQGLKLGDEDITRRYFYGYLRITYNVYDVRYGLSRKTDMDFYSLAHDYYMRLLLGNWQQLEARREEVSLRSWLTGGFRFLILDRLKTHHPAGEELSELRFDVPDDHFQEEVRQMLEEVIDTQFWGDRQSQGILRMILIGGFKSKEVAAQLGISPSAVSQRYRRMMDEVIIPYFKRNYESEVAVPYEKTAACFMEEADYGDFTPASAAPTLAVPSYPRTNKLTDMNTQRITPDHITRLAENEVFVFGSNLAGMHGGGAAYIAYKKFGARMGQGVGLQGQSYGIPTMQGGVETIVHPHRLRHRRLRCARYRTALRRGPRRGEHHAAPGLLGSAGVTLPTTCFLILHNNESYQHCGCSGSHRALLPGHRNREPRILLRPAAHRSGHRCLPRRRH